MTIPVKLKRGDTIRIIAPSRSLGIISTELRQIADARLNELGFKLSFSKHAEEMDDFKSSSVASRVEDIHEAFRDSSVTVILTAIGGFNSNQLLQYLDYDLIKKNPKILCGYSDITALQNAIYARTGLVTYSGPHYSSFGEQLYFDYSLEYFKKCLMNTAPFDVLPSREWSNDAWYKDQDNRHLKPNTRYVVLNEGEAEGTLIGGNLGTFNLLQGTPYFPSLKNAVLFLEDDSLSDAVMFDRDLQSLIHVPEFAGVKGVVIGRFEEKSAMAPELLEQIVKTKKELANIPVIVNADFGHTEPKITFPIGGTAKLTASKNGSSVRILKH
jgi:muramoyltetrapeptide carboxypeptidase LdcA involved in peptidoglycan recycling